MGISKGQGKQDEHIINEREGLGGGREILELFTQNCDELILTPCRLENLYVLYIHFPSSPQIVLPDLLEKVNRAIAIGKW